MKNIACIILLVCIAPSVRGISLLAGGGFLYGRSEALVFADSSSSNLMSRLVWPLEGLAYWELGFGFGRERGTDFSFFAEGSIKFGIPGRTGIMTNTDWLGPSSYKTHFSAHDGLTDRALLGDFRVGYLFPITTRLFLAPTMTLSTLSFSWTARDGYIQYGPNFGGAPYVPWSPSFEKVPFYGAGILYTQDWLILAFGVDLTWDISERVELRAGISASPFIICGAQDDHLLRNIRYIDVMTGGYALYPSINLVYRLGRNFSLLLRGGYRYLGGVRGDTTYETIDSGRVIGMTDHTAGTVYSVLDMGIGVRYSLLR